MGDLVSMFYAEARSVAFESYPRAKASTYPSNFELTDEHDFEHLVTEDNEPVDNTFSEKQQRLLTTSLYHSWSKQRPFLTMANVGLFYAVDEEPLVPDVLVSLDVKVHKDPWPKTKRPYFVSQYGKPPEIVIEIVSNTTGKEDTKKLSKYAKAKVDYYVIFDPLDQLKQGLLRVYELRRAQYVEKSDLWLDKVGLGLTFWEGEFEDMSIRWLRWCDEEGQLILTDTENKLQVIKEKEAAQKRAEQAEIRAKQAEKRAERLAAQLQALGIKPDEP